ncbi:MAG: hypothetical protein M3Y58_00980 [Chloroflexota bacterium]|nr:hypothetical protein [Chloroflexota bacterium]
MTIALFPRRADAVRRLTDVRSAVRSAVASLPARKPEPQSSVNMGRWETLPGEYAGAWACPLDERFPAITAPGLTAPIACGQNASVVLHLAGTWSGHVIFEGSADGITWRRVILAALTGDATGSTTDRPGLWRTLPDQHITHLRLHVARLSHGTILAAIAAAPSVGHPLSHALNPAA